MTGISSPESGYADGGIVAHDVFISHATKDKGVADAICAALEAAEIRCWVAPRDIPPAAEWATSIVDALRVARVMVLVLSENAINSDHVKRELTVARGSWLKRTWLNLSQGNRVGRNE